MSDKIEGIPDGWRVVRIGSANKAGYWMDEDGSIKPSLTGHIRGLFYPIVERIKPPEPTYRPFANAAEFEPYRDKWICDPQDQLNKFKAIAYNDQGVFSFKRFWGYSQLFDCGTVFEDGTRFGVNEAPFGIKVSGRVW